MFLNTLNALCEQEEAVSIRAKSMDSTLLSPTSAQVSTWSIILVGVVPAACILLGVMIVIRRKRR